MINNVSFGTVLVKTIPASKQAEPYRGNFEYFRTGAVPAHNSKSDKALIRVERLTTQELQDRWGKSPEDDVKYWEIDSSPENEEFLVQEWVILSAGASWIDRKELDPLPRSEKKNFIDRAMSIHLN